MEGIAFSLRIPQRKPWGTMLENIASAKEIAEDRFKMLNGVPENEKSNAESFVDAILTSLDQLELRVSEQDPEKVAIRVGDVMASVSELKLLQTPGLPYLIPRTYADLPKLAGRGLARFEIENASGTPKTIEIVLDGYSSPLSSGAFAANVVSRAFDGQKLSVDSDSVVLNAKPETEFKEIPLEIFSVGQFEPSYRRELEVQYGEVPVLPLSIFGAVALTHSPNDDESSSPNEAFIFKFDRGAAGLGGMAFDEGKFSVIGYVTTGLEILPRLQTGDTIRRAELVRGREFLIFPETAT